jgi:hypothetical protein
MRYLKLKNLKAIVLALMCISIAFLFISNDRIKQFNRMIATSLEFAQNNASILLDVVTNSAVTTTTTTTSQYLNPRTANRSAMGRIEREVVKKKLMEILVKNQNKLVAKLNTTSDEEVTNSNIAVCANENFTNTNSTGI